MESAKNKKRSEHIRSSKKQVIAYRLTTPPPSAGIVAKDTLPDPCQTKETDPEILPEAGETKDKVATPEGDG